MRAEEATQVLAMMVMLPAMAEAIADGTAADLPMREVVIVQRHGAGAIAVAHLLLREAIVDPPEVDQILVVVAEAIEEHANRKVSERKEIVDNG